MEYVRVDVACRDMQLRRSSSPHSFGHRFHFPIGFAQACWVQGRALVQGKDNEMARAEFGQLDSWSRAKTACTEDNEIGLPYGICSGRCKRKDDNNIFMPPPPAVLTAEPYARLLAPISRNLSAIRKVRARLSLVTAGPDAC